MFRAHGLDTTAGGESASALVDAATAELKIAKANLKTMAASVNTSKAIIDELQQSLDAKRTVPKVCDLQCVLLWTSGEVCTEMRGEGMRGWGENNCFVHGYCSQ